ncbi:hypothetical protein BGX38DRAFT_1206535 [Terfezia claveryi]|nr:hypothetical protein BGX38DRAFT_1206535 [Terfezia claveryi]
MSSFRAPLALDITLSCWLGRGSENLGECSPCQSLWETSGHHKTCIVVVTSCRRSAALFVCMRDRLLGLCRSLKATNN